MATSVKKQSYFDCRKYSYDKYLDKGLAPASLSLQQSTVSKVLDDTSNPAWRNIFKDSSGGGNGYGGGDGGVGLDTEYQPCGLLRSGSVGILLLTRISSEASEPPLGQLRDHSGYESGSEGSK